MAIQNETHIQTYVRNTFQSIIRGYTQKVWNGVEDFEVIEQELNGLEAFISECEEALFYSGSHGPAQLADELDLWPDFEIDENARPYVARLLVMALLIALKHSRDMLLGNFGPIPDISFLFAIPDQLEGPVKVIQSNRRPGRPPKTDWIAMAVKAEEIIVSGDVKPTKHGWRTDVAERLADWSKDQFGREIKKETIRDHTGIKAVLDHFESADKL